MKNYTSFIKKGLLSLSALVATGVSLVAFTGMAQAAQIPYVPGQPLPAPSTPAFNIYSNVPAAVGDESDFVRLRTSTGDPANNGLNGERNSLYKSTINDACTIGSKFDVRTYIHNGADPEQNDNGNGPVVAHGVAVNMTAPLNKNGKSFDFSSTISATNAQFVSDSGKLNCASEVRLKLVSSTVKVYSRPLGWLSESDTAVNGSIRVGSHVKGSGDVHACWDERVLVVYVIEVVEAEKPATPIYTCDLLTLTFMGDRKYKFDVTATAKNGATVKEYKFDFNDGSAVVTSATNSVEHKFANDGKYTPKAEVVFNVTTNGVTKTETATSANCAKTIDITAKPVCDVPGKGHLPKDSPECKKTPAALPNTGAGSTMAIIVTAVAAIGAYAHRAFTLKRQ
jgi:hypothetical protein